MPYPNSIDVSPPYPEDGTIFLRPWTLDDQEFVFMACADGAIHQYTSMPDPSEKAARDWIQSQPKRRQEGTAVHFAVTDSKQRVVGNVGFVDFVWKYQRAEVGYWVLPAHRGNGYAERALRLLGDWAFAALPLARIDLFTDIENEATKRVATRARYTYEGRLRSFRTYRGQRVDLDVFSLLPSDPR
jgi:[ribosomal protein S5]-alanine N-acetyltransferase